MNESSNADDKCTGSFAFAVSIKDTGTTSYEDKLWRNGEGFGCASIRIMSGNFTAAPSVSDTQSVATIRAAQ